MRGWRRPLARRGSGTAARQSSRPECSSTFITSLVGAGTYALLALTTTGDIAPDRLLGLTGGLGGLTGGYLGARLQPHLPETALRLLLGALAIVVGTFYAVQGLR